MNRAALASLIGQLPKAQRERAGRIIVHAEKLGWTNIGMWTEDAPADIADLVGNDAKGKFDFLPDEEPESQAGTKDDDA